MSSSCKPIFIHGWATDSRVWQPLSEGFSGAVLCGLPGHGTQRRWHTTGLEPAVDRLVEALEGKEGPFVAVGWSLGAKVALKAVMDGRIELRGLVLVGASPSFVKREGFPHGQSVPLVRRMLMDFKSSPEETLKRFYPLNFTERELSTDEAQRFLSLYSSIPEGFVLEDVSVALKTLMEVDLRAGLKELNLPVLIVHGTEDGVCPPQCAEYLKENIDGARVEWFEGCGHAPFVTEPERFKELLRRFMETL